MIHRIQNHIFIHTEVIPKEIQFLKKEHDISVQSDFSCFSKRFEKNGLSAFSVSCDMINIFKDL